MIDLQQVAKSYSTGSVTLPVLRGIDLQIKPGEFVALMGPSGSGKSTLLNVLGLIDTFDTGDYRLCGISMKDLSETEAARHRVTRIGFIFQSFNLLPAKTAADNVALPLYYQGVAQKKRRTQAMELLEQLGVVHRAHHRPRELSGGQQQRVAIARALITDPPMILADEPTGNLDSTAAHDVMQLLDKVHHAGRTIVLVTHDESIAAHAQRIVRLHDGRVAGVA
ncbi:MAG TPA: ABC transporter ATP-binding protein [Nitrospira sp.]|nr:ABC transporter ATP-binding protein [Nitrospira sp.]